MQDYVILQGCGAGEAQEVLLWAVFEQLCCQQLAALTSSFASDACSVLTPGCCCCRLTAWDPV